MLTQETKNEIGQLLTSFISEMYEWEKICNIIAKDNTLTFEQKFSKQKKIVCEIFEKYCTDKERKNGRPNTIFYGSDGSFNYDPEEEIIKDYEPTDNKNRIIVYTEKTGPLPSLNQYLVINKKGIWLIDSKKRYSNWQKKWVIESL